MTTIIKPTKTIEEVSSRNTGVLVIFTALTNLADGVTKVALPLMATMLTASPALVAGVSVTLTLPSSSGTVTVKAQAPFVLGAAASTFTETAQ